MYVHWYVQKLKQRKTLDFEFSEAREDLAVPVLEKINKKLSRIGDDEIC